ncbi:hypothetical protein ACNKHL_04615 [Shigella flexneri]
MKYRHVKNTGFISFDGKTRLSSIR